MSRCRKAGGDWFGVRCVFRDANNGTYEERITLWRASEVSEAVAMAESEAVDYVKALDGVSYVRLAQAFSIDGEPGHGVEVFSLIRDSDLEASDYISRFFDTGSERQEDI
ncbi:hypothetical protein E1298_41770 [Actinomadura rubrisoli]|uniref:DUF4288 domain-containing protein n=2 Tax=Actinomadura rubrisoli TaxID=2530368 RepID=A0A4V2YRG2_9ACTN|nr:hypothetical protein E1298_41770 [Actinomadura rubrisoli]